MQVPACFYRLYEDVREFFSQILENFANILNKMKETNNLNKNME
jgi:hypothetical protein